MTVITLVFKFFSSFTYNYNPIARANNPTFDLGELPFNITSNRSERINTDHAGFRGGLSVNVLRIHRATEQ